MTWVRARTWPCLLLVGFGPVRAAADANLTMTLTADPATPDPGQVFTITAAVLDQGPDPTTHGVEVHFRSNAGFGELVSSSSSGSGCTVDPLCVAFTCDSISLYCELGLLAPGSAKSASMQLTARAVSSPAIVTTAGACEVTSLGGACTSAAAPQGSVSVPPQPGQPQASSSGGCSTGGAPASLLLAVVSALRCATVASRGARSGHPTKR